MAEPKKAIRMFRRFHTRDWRGEGDFPASFCIPDDVVMLGPAVNILYGSDKLNPTTGEDEGWIEYIHEHEAGVHVYVPGGRNLPRHLETARVCRVPAWIRDVEELTWLGDCLGWAYKDDGGSERKAQATKPLPELYTIPSGKALLVVQSKRTVLAIFWGGKLNVERRGIVH